MKSELLYWLWLASVTELIPAKKSRLARALPDPADIYDAPPQLLREIETITGDDVEKIRKHRDLRPVVEMAGYLQKNRISLITMKDPDYPDALFDLKDPPAVLFAKGNRRLIQAPVKIGVVGSRSCTPYGRGQAEKFSARFSASGVAVVSGLAAGIDASAHRGALRYHGSTIAVLGCGIDQCYPMINWELYEQIARDGLLISEYYPGEKALPYHFPTRNRIISGLSDALLVIEARQKSGALITAGLALDQGKDVYAIPQNITMEKGFGSNELLKSGALLATEPEDVLFGVCADLRVRSGLQVTSRDTAGIKQKHKSGNSFDPAKEKCLTDLNRRILGKIQDGADTPDKLIEAAGISIMAMNQALSELELDGFIKIEFGRIFAL